MRKHIPQHIVRTAFDMKSDAHMLIDEIRSYGVSKSAIYYIVAKKLNIPIREAHLKHACTLEQIEKIIWALERVSIEAEMRYKHKHRHERKEANRQRCLEEGKRLHEEAVARKLKAKELGIKKPTKKQNTLPLAKQKELIAKMHSTPKKSLYSLLITQPINRIIRLTQLLL